MEIQLMIFRKKMEQYSWVHTAIYKNYLGIYWKEIWAATRPRIEETPPPFSECVLYILNGKTSRSRMDDKHHIKNR
jgi:hypothetical protein